MRYILDENGNPRPEPDLLKWTSFGTANRIVARDQIGSVLVSTVFLGLDHNFLGNGPPVLWETMISPLIESGPYQNFQTRYSSKEDALEGHRKLVQMFNS
jgi:hypothetical protein